MECARLFGLHSFRGTSKEIRRLVKQDKANFIDQVVSEANGVQGSDTYTKPSSPCESVDYNGAKAFHRYLDSKGQKASSMRSRQTTYG